MTFGIMKAANAWSKSRTSEILARKEGAPLLHPVVGRWQRTQGFVQD